MTDPVLIVGAGPTGLTAAFELSRLGIPVRLIDKREGPATTSRAIGVQARTLELLDQRGLADDVSPAHGVLKRRDGSLERVACPWLIGAEGAHSLVRTTLDLSYEGHTREEQYALGDLLIDGDLPDTDFHIFSSEHGFMGLFPMGSDHFRLIASNPLSEPSRGTAPSLQELQAIYNQRSHIPARFHGLTWSSWFRINSRMVPRLRIGRFFLGGDAAHIHS